jgi:protein ImuA
MPATKKDIQQLRKEILALQGLSSPHSPKESGIEIGPLKYAFPNACFPLGAVHEFISTESEHKAASSGFIASLISFLMKDGGICLWIGPFQRIFPPSLKTFGIEAEHIIFVNIQNEKEILWTMEEALKCKGLAAVVGEIREISFTASRRLQLAVEHSRVTGFILRHQPLQLNTNVCVSRWQIRPLPSDSEDDLPGVGFPRWQVELMKIRNGRPGIWQLEWSFGQFYNISSPADPLSAEQERKTG